MTHETTTDAGSAPLHCVVGRINQENPFSWAFLAKGFAEKYHCGKYRRDGITPYVSHPAAVAACFESDYCKAVAWLHDVLEDTDANIGDLASVFPDEIVDAVMAITKREGQDYQQYLEQVAASPLAKAVKIADIKHNLSDSPTLKQIEKYRKALEYLEPNRELTGGEALRSDVVVGPIPGTEK
jgi:(p)ppGpp synthase/HD superfamily hydrolase